MRERVCPHFLPETGGRDVIKGALLDWLTGPSVNQKLRCALASAGFNVTRVEKHWFHDCWEIQLMRGQEMLADSEPQIRRRVRNALKSESMYSGRDNLSVSIQGRRLIVGFISKLGAVGRI